MTDSHRNAETVQTNTGIAAGPDRVVCSMQSISKIYTMGEVQIPALKHVSLELREGEFIVILGVSRSGKSTLLNILGGLETPTEGKLTYLGHDLSSASDAELTKFRRDHVGFVFKFYNLIPSLTALENVELVTEISPAPMDAAEALARVGLQDRLHHFPAQLSGGEQQRVARMAGALNWLQQVSAPSFPTIYRNDLYDLQENFHGFVSPGLE